MSGNYGKNIKPHQHTNRVNFLDRAVYEGQTEMRDCATEREPPYTKTHPANSHAPIGLAIHVGSVAREVQLEPKRTSPTYERRNLVRNPKTKTHKLSAIVTFILLVSTIVVNYQAGVSADESYFGSRQWHYLAWILPVLFLLSLVWAWFERKRVQKLNRPSA